MSGPGRVCANLRKRGYTKHTRKTVSTAAIWKQSTNRISRPSWNPTRWTIHGRRSGNEKKTDLRRKFLVDWLSQRVGRNFSTSAVDGYYLQKKKKKILFTHKGIYTIRGEGGKTFTHIVVKVYGGTARHIRTCTCTYEYTHILVSVLCLGTEGDTFIGVHQSVHGCPAHLTFDN